MPFEALNDLNIKDLSCLSLFIVYQILLLNVHKIQLYVVSSNLMQYDLKSILSQNAKHTFSAETPADRETFVREKVMSLKRRRLGYISYSDMLIHYHKLKINYSTKLVGGPATLEICISAMLKLH